MTTTDIVIPEPLQRQVGPVAERFAKERAELFEMVKNLVDRPPTEMTAALAVEYDTRAKSFEAKAKEAFAPMIAVAFKTHRSLTGVLNSVCEPVGQLRRISSSKISAYALEVEKAKQAAAAPARRAEIVEREDEALKGVSVSQTWKVDDLENDLPKLIQHIAAHPNLMFLVPKAELWEGEINRFLHRMKGKTDLPIKVKPDFIKRNRNSDE